MLDAFYHLNILLLVKKLRILMSRSLGRKRFWFQQNRQENPVNTNENQEVNNDSKL